MNTTAIALAYPISLYLVSVLYMIMLKVSDELFGPHSVIAHIISNVRAASIILTDKAVSSTGLIIGILT